MPAASSTTFVFCSLVRIPPWCTPFPYTTLFRSLGGGSSSAGSTVVTIPADTTPGTYYLIVLADGGQTVRESIETKRTSATSPATGPDLKLSSLSTTLTALPGSTITVTDTTQNFG